MGKIIINIVGLIFGLKLISIVYGYLDGFYWGSLNVSGFYENIQKHVQYGLIEIVVMLIGVFGFFGKTPLKWVMISIYPYLVIGVGLVFLFGFNQTFVNFQLQSLIIAYVILIFLNLLPMIKRYKIGNLKSQLVCNGIGFFIGITIAFLFF